VTARTARRAGRREWVGLAVIALPCLLATMDLEPSSSQLLWIVDSTGS
jgi:DHA2 family multidrug resistance protein-like MFS transporter